MLGIADFNSIHHIQPPSFSSPLSLYYQFIYNHHMSFYQTAESYYTTLLDLYPWWRKGIDRYSSILYILKKEELLSSLTKQVNQFESSLPEVSLFYHSIYLFSLLLFNIIINHFIMMNLLLKY